MVLGIVLAGSTEVANARLSHQQRDGTAVVADASVLDQARQLHVEAERHITSRQFKEAADKIEKALALRRQQLGERHPDVAQSIGRQGIIAYCQGDYAKAETLATDALAIREAALPPDHLDVAESLSDVATMILVRGDYVDPSRCFSARFRSTRRVPLLPAERSRS